MALVYVILKWRQKTCYEELSFLALGGINMNREPDPLMNLFGEK